MKNFVRVGNRFFNPHALSYVEMSNLVPPKVKIRLDVPGTGGPQYFDFEGDDAETVLEEVGYGKDVREQEATAKLKAAHDREQEDAARVANEEQERGAAARRAEMATPALPTPELKPEPEQKPTPARAAFVEETKKGQASTSATTAKGAGSR